MDVELLMIDSFIWFRHCLKMLSDFILFFLRFCWYCVSRMSKYSSSSSCIWSRSAFVLLSLGDCIRVNSSMFPVVRNECSSGIGSSVCGSTTFWPCFLLVGRNCVIDSWFLSFFVFGAMNGEVSIWRSLGVGDAS